MKYFITIFLLICTFEVGISNTEQIKIVKTFDYNNTVDHTLEFSQDNKIYRLYHTVKKDDHFVGIKYDISHSFISFDSLAPILKKLISSADEINPRKLTLFTTFEFLNCEEITKKSILAFNANPEYAEILKANIKSTGQVYDFIQSVLIKEGVFSKLIRLFSDIGYKIELSSIEKIAFRKAKEFAFYPELKQNGISPETVFPVPLILYFDMKSKM